jgi:predicted alpha/beta hydrolase family esterase
MKQKKTLLHDYYMKFVLIHGALGSPEGNWFPYFKHSLETLEQEVIVPRFPVDTWEGITKNGPEKPAVKQNLSNWLDVFEPIAKTFRKGEKLCFVGHSLGPLFILHTVSRFDIRLDSAIFVTPFLDVLHRMWQIDHVNASFYKTDFDFNKLKERIPISYTLFSNNDPYVPITSNMNFATSLGSSCIEVRGAGHFNEESGFTSFPLVIELCKTRLENLAR